MSAVSIYGLGSLLPLRDLSHEREERTKPITALRRIITAIQNNPSTRRLAVSVSVVSLIALAISIRGFIWNHPGVVLVLLGVIGENIWDEKATTGAKAMFRFSAWILIFGLAVEMFEAVAMDGEVAKLKNTATAAMERAVAAQKKLQPRWLGDDDRFAKALKGKRSGNASLIFSQESSESLGFITSIEIELFRAGWHVRKPDVSLEQLPRLKATRGDSGAGITIVMHEALPSSQYSGTTAADALGAAFSAAGYRPKFIAPTPGLVPADGEILILVGRLLNP